LKGGYRVSLSTGDMLRSMEGIHLLGFLREKKKYIWVPLLDPEDIKVLWYQIMGDKRPIYKA
jgi:hypothetical protein